MSLAVSRPRRCSGRQILASWRYYALSERWDYDDMFIDGAWTADDAVGVIEVIDPATEEVIGSVPDAGLKATNAAIAAARRAFDDGPWPRTSPRDRAKVLRRFAAILDERHDFLKKVVAAITPFNSPFFLNIVKVLPALAAGCTLVLKPHQWTPLDAFEIAKAAQDADLPPGVLNVIAGGPEVGEEMTTHPLVDMVTFTGSTPTGRAIMAAAAPPGKRPQIQPGGQNAM